MNGQGQSSRQELAAKIAGLVEERGWNQEEFARTTGLNRQTVRDILQLDGSRRLRNGTILRCARALGVSVNDLHRLPLERLLDLNRRPAAPWRQGLSYDRATQPELSSWMARQPERARGLTAGEMDELLSLQGTGGPLTPAGVEHFVNLIERKRRLMDRIHAIAGTEQLDLLEKIVEVLYQKIQPYADRC